MPELTREALAEIIRKQHPPDLSSLKKYLSRENFQVNEERFSDLIKELVSNGTIKTALKPGSSFSDYLLDVWTAWWFYASIGISLFELLLVISNSQTDIALALRMIFGLVVLGIIPGFLTTVALFPRDQLATLERISLSMFLSVLISIGVGVALGLGPYFQPSNNIIVLAGYVVTMSIAASYRSYKFSQRF